MNGGGGRREQPKAGWEVWPLPMAQEQGLWSLCCHFSSKIGHKAVEGWVGTRRKIFLKKERSRASQGLTSLGRVILPWLSPEHWPTKLGWQENLRSQVLAEQSRAMPLTTSPKLLFKKAAWDTGERVWGRNPGATFLLSFWQTLLE